MFIDVVHVRLPAIGDGDILRGLVFMGGCNISIEKNGGHVNRRTACMQTVIV